MKKQPIKKNNNPYRRIQELAGLLNEIKVNPVSIGDNMNDILSKSPEILSDYYKGEYDFDEYEEPEFYEVDAGSEVWRYVQYDFDENNILGCWISFYKDKLMEFLEDEGLIDEGDDRGIKHVNIRGHEAYIYYL